MVRIGAINFWEDLKPEGCSILYTEFNNYILNAFKYKGIEYTFLDCTKERCDIIFVSVFNKFDVHALYPGNENALFVLYTGEYIYEGGERKEDESFPYSLEMGFRKDSQTSLYLPLWQINYDRMVNNPVLGKSSMRKTDFASFIVSHGYSKLDGCLFRNKVFHYISDNYKKVYSCGGYENNIGMKFPICHHDFSRIQMFHRSIKFNICFENKGSKGDISYITEKILHAYIYGTVPVYWGSEDVEEWFNPESFVNCNGLSECEILDKLIELDTNDKKYYRMLNAKPFRDNSINWKTYTYNRIINFLEKNGFNFGQKLYFCSENDLS